MIAMKGVTMSYPGNDRVLDQVSFELNKGEFIYLVGGTGTGKSSLLRIIATEEQPTAGSIFLFGYSLATASSSTLRSIRRSIGYVPQDVRLISDFSVFDNVAVSVSLGGRRLMRAETRSRINELLERVGLADKRDVLASALSGGEAQRVAVVRAVARNPELLIADEPTGAQDREATWGLMDVFLRANLGGTTMVVATHDREIVRRVRKRCGTLKGGRLTLESTLCIY